MDLTTTLVTFMLQTSSSTHSVSLLGSWDNFSARYPMENDTKRDRGQWRGCYAFKDIICDGESSNQPRDGGLKMGHSYWYYYELDDGTEIHDPSLPSTSSCPYLPGQPVNLLWVPIQVNALRERSASLNSIDAMAGEYQTLRPEDRYRKPRAVPELRRRVPRLSTSAIMTEEIRSVRSMSPRGERPPRSARNLFGMRRPTPTTPAGVAGPAYDCAILYHSSSDEETFASHSALNTAFGEEVESTPSSTFSTRVTSPNPQYNAHVSQHSPNLPSPQTLLATSSASTSVFSHLIRPLGVSNDEFDNLSVNIGSDDGFTNVVRSADLDNGLSSSGTSARKSSSHSQRSPSESLWNTISGMRPLPMVPNERTQSAPSPPKSGESTARTHPLPMPSRLAPPPPIFNRNPDLNMALSNSFNSFDTLSSGLISPTDSQMSSVPSIYESNDDDEDEVNCEADGSISLPRQAWNGYSLPVEDAGSEMTLRKDVFPDAAVTVGKDSGRRVDSRELIGLGSGLEARLDQALTIGAEGTETGIMGYTARIGKEGKALDRMIEEMWFNSELLD